MRKRNDTLSDILRILTQLEKAINRLRRQNHYNSKQGGPLFEKIERAIQKMRDWINQLRAFTSIDALFVSLGLAVKRIGEFIALLGLKVSPLPGKKRTKKSRLENDRRQILKTVDSMLGHVADIVKNSRRVDNDLALELEKYVLKSFEAECVGQIEEAFDALESDRGEKTYIFPWKEPDSYEELIADPVEFKSQMKRFLRENKHTTGHKSFCSDHSRYNLCGFRSRPRMTDMPTGRKIYPIRMVQCRDCGQRFSMVPSFLPREKNFSLEIIGSVCESMLRFGASIQAGMQSLQLIAKPVRSKQTILNWLRCIGALDPATVLTRAGVVGSGYLQEDEGFEKEPNLRTYSAVLVDPKNLLVWHCDYLDGVDEDSLVCSFEKFVQKIEFKIHGVTKDKWLGSTNALKKVLKNVWIGFCRRHFLKKLFQELKEYQKQTKCSDGKISSLYKEVKKILETASSESALRARLNHLLQEDAFEHPLLKSRIESLMEDGVHYTCVNKRKGIAPTTSIVDNFLKIVKRKLRQAESFRDPEHAGCLFRAMANARNFLPFLPGAKNAHKSPFMLAEGETFDLPWIQTMNVHNAFLLSRNAC
jgi:hypothetical protein